MGPGIGLRDKNGSEMMDVGWGKMSGSVGAGRTALEELTHSAARTIQANWSKSLQ